MNAVETLAAEVNRLDGMCSSLLGVIAALKDGTLDPDDVEVDLAARSWQVRQEPERGSAEVSMADLVRMAALAEGISAHESENGKGD